MMKTLLFVILPLSVMLVSFQNCAKSTTPASSSTTTSESENAIDITKMGADRTCSTDATAAINSALAQAAQTLYSVKIPAGCYLVSDALTLPAKTSADSSNMNRAISIIGEGANTTVIRVSSQFNMSASGVFVLKQNLLYAKGAHLEGLSIVFSQPNSSNISNMIHYPVAINIDGAYGSEIESVNIWDAWDGVSAKGTYTSGTYIPDASAWQIHDVGMTAYHVGIDQDGSWDTIQIDNFHFQFTFHDWGQNPSLVAAKGSIFNDYAIAIQTGKADDIKISNSLLAGQTALKGGVGAINNGAYIEISSTSFDSGATVLWENPMQLQITNSNFYLSDVSPLQTSPMVYATKGNIMISNSYFNSTSTRSARPLISYHPIAGALFTNYGLSVTGCVFNLNGGNANQAGAIDIAVASGLILNTIISNNIFYRTNVAAYSKAIIGVLNSGYLNLTVQGNSFTQESGATGNWVSIDNDGPYNISGNIFTANLTKSYPAVRVTGVYQ